METHVCACAGRHDDRQGNDTILADRSALRYDTPIVFFIFVLVIGKGDGSDALSFFCWIYCGCGIGVRVAIVARGSNVAPS